MSLVLVYPYFILVYVLVYACSPLVYVPIYVPNLCAKFMCLFSPLVYVHNLIHSLYIDTKWAHTQAIDVLSRIEIDSLIDFGKEVVKDESLF